MKDYITKSIAYAYPTSPLADKYNRGYGFYFIQVTRKIENSGQYHSDIEPSKSVFATAAEALPLLTDTEGALCPHFVRYMLQDIIKEVLDKNS